MRILQGNFGSGLTLPIRNYTCKIAFTPSCPICKDWNQGMLPTRGKVSLVLLSIQCAALWIVQERDMWSVKMQQAQRCMYGINQLALGMATMEKG